MNMVIRFVYWKVIFATTVVNNIFGARSLPSNALKTIPK